MVSREQIEALANIDDMSDRLEAAARLCTGNIVEIGGGEGINTLRFLKVARDKKKTVIVIDPFEQIPGTDESYFKPYSKDNFLKATEGYYSELLLIETVSQEENLKRDLNAFNPIGLMFIDGLQYKESVLSDLRLAESLNAEIICVDDFDRETSSSQVPEAVTEFSKNTNYTFVEIGEREAYFIK